MADQKRPHSAGLKWRKRVNGPDVPYWFADPKAVAAGYPIKSANLGLHAAHPSLLKERAGRLQSEMLLWMSGYKKSEKEFDGTFKSLFEIYQRDPKKFFQYVAEARHCSALYDIPQETCSPRRCQAHRPLRRPRCYGMV
jgi:hypothetical protein